jgi:hypothetical protein
VVVAGEVAQDRAVRPMVPAARRCQLPQRRPHGGQLGDLAVEVGYVFERDRFDRTARLVPQPQPDEAADPLDREAEGARPVDEAERVDVRLRIDPVAGWRARGGANEPDRLVVADQLGRDAGRLRRLPDVHRRLLDVGGAQPRSSNALVTTLTLLSAIAAPATTGLNRPNAASGMPMTLYAKAQNKPCRIFV